MTSALAPVPVLASEDRAFQIVRLAHSANPDSPDAIWKVLSWVGSDASTMGIYDEATARQVLSFCSLYPGRARAAIRALYLEGDEHPLELFVQSARASGAKTLVATRVSVEFDLTMIGDESSVREYVAHRMNFIGRARNIKVAVNVL